MRRRLVALAAATFGALALAAAPAPGFAGANPQTRMIYRVDSVTAKVTGRKLVVTATGAVTSGGWEDAQLRALPVRKSETGTLTIEFRATPPAPDAVVIQALLPVSATATLPLPRYATSKVEVKSQTNAMTTQIVVTRK